MKHFVLFIQHQVLKLNLNSGKVALYSLQTAETDDWDLLLISSFIVDQNDEHLSNNWWYDCIELKT